MNQKGFGKASIFLLIIVVIVIISGVIFFFKSQKPYTNDNSNLNTLPQDSTSGEWKIYRNDIYGFEVQYPPYGFLTRDGWRYSADYGDYYIVEIRIPSPPAFFIDVDPKRNCDTFNFQNSNMNIDGNPAIKEIKYFSDGTEYRNVHFIKGEQCYVIQMMGPGFEDAEKMLTTFKFTN